MSAELLAPLADELARLWRASQPSSAGLRRFARDLLLTTLDADGFADTLVARSDASTAGVSNASERILAQTITTGRVVAWFSLHFATLQSQAEDLVLAALLADAACCKPQQKSMRRSIGPTDAAHIPMAAALAAGLVDAPTSVAKRISRHHERADGTGFPHGLTAARLTVDDQAIMAAVRFAEVFAGSPLAAAKRLYHEARLGLFDVELTANLLWSLGGEFPSEGRINERAPQPWARTDFGRQRLRIDAAHDLVRAPHFTGVPKSLRPALPAR